MKAWITFEKKPRLRHIGHLDLMRAMQRALRKSDLPICFSKGFNPHLQLTFAAPLSVGMYGLHEVMEVFYQKDLGLIVENVSAEDNSLVDSFEGRSVNPGHSLEAMWFIMDLGKRLGRPELIDKAVKIALSTIEYGWDKQYGGIFYFMDRLGRPQQQLEWDQKLWWVHIESAITMIKGYQLTGNKECLAWFQKLHDYMWTHFKDPKYPEWFGYLNRRGEVLLPLKGGKWKGCFHVPRGLYQIWQILEQCK